MYFNIGRKPYTRKPSVYAGFRSMYFNIGRKPAQMVDLLRKSFRSMYFNIGQKIKFVQFNKKGNINNV